MRTYDIVEVGKKMFKVGWLRKRWFRKPAFHEIAPNVFYTVEAARQWIEDHEKYLAHKAYVARTFPRLVEFGYVACDGRYHQLRDDDS